MPKFPKLVYKKGHPLANSVGQLREYRLILYEKIGPGTHPCHWCGRTVEWRRRNGPGEYECLVVDHLDCNQHNNDPRNLVPSCNGCNSNRPIGGRIRADEIAVDSGSGLMGRGIIKACWQCGTSLKITLAKDRYGLGKFCSLSCNARFWRLLEQNADAWLWKSAWMTERSIKRKMAAEV